MSPLVRKEIRLILPFWAIALVLAIVPMWIPSLNTWWRLPEGVYWIFAFGVMLLGLAPFGQEFGLGTFTSLLAQPSERSRLWKVKVLVALVAAAVVFVAFMLSSYARLDSEFSAYFRDLIEKQHHGYLPAGPNIADREALGRLEIKGGLWYSANLGLLLLLVALTGGFWTTLLFRQTGAALWFAILIPGVLIPVVQGICHVFSPVAQDGILVNILILYSIAGVVAAWRMFAQAQDFQWLGETVALFNFKSSRTQADSDVPRRKGAIRALVRKELQSHQISFLIAFGLLVLHICTLVFRGVYVLPRNSELRFAVEGVPLLWLLIPWLMGCTSIAEERKLGTMESQLCLPVNRRLQFAVKFTVVLVLGTLIGGLIPFLVEGVGSFAGVFSEIVRSTSSAGPTYFATLFELLISAALIALVSLFASSLTRNTLHALGAAIVFAVGWVGLVEWAAAQPGDYTFLRGPLILVIGIPIALIATIALSFSNYKTLHAGRRVWLRTFAVLFGTLACASIATAVIYQRPWELVMSVEPQRGAGQLTGPVRPVIRTAAFRLFALLPDGRLWTGTDYHTRKLRPDVQAPNDAGNVSDSLQVTFPSSGIFVAGSNWVEIAVSHDIGEAVGLKSDGTLWEIFPRESSTNAFSHNTWLTLRPNPQRIGSDYWKTVAAGYSDFYGIKTNGTLWQWWSATDPERRRGWTQIATNSDWSKFFSRDRTVLVMRANGELWGWRDVAGKWGFERTGLNGSNWQNASGNYWQGAVGGYSQDLLIHQDGTLWARSRSSPRHVFGYRIPADPNGAQVRVGNDSDWLEILGQSPDLYALKKNGRLLRNGTEVFSTALGRPSKYSDWIAAENSNEWYQRIALAADGTVCCWVDSRLLGGANVFFAPTRRPVWTLNLLTDSKN